MFQQDIEREFDLLLRRAVPFLIFGPPEMRNQLANLLQPLCHLYISNSTQVDEFNARRSMVEEVLEGAERNEDRKLGANTLHAVQSLVLRQKSIYALLQDHETRLSKLERRGNVKTTRSPVAPPAVPETQPATDDVVPVSTSVISTGSASETTEASSPSNVESIAKDSSICIVDEVVACLKAAGKGNGLTIKEISEKTGLTCAQVTRVTSGRRAANRRPIKKIDSHIQERTDSLGVSRKHNVGVYCWTGDE